ncbi:MAG: hypothetical protein HOE90_18390 [Bacteriovoracaceae bacterium]|nr:hypothetical protein [Bacteriovoracaceae bacterium]
MGKTNEMVEYVLSYDRLNERIKGRAQDKKKALKILNEIKSDFSFKSINRFKNFLDNTLMRLYDEVALQVPDNMDLNELYKNNCLIFVPNHQSHADYLAISYKLAGTDYRLPIHITAGINLNFFPVGKIFRSAGAFFIRRSFNSDILYKITLEAYISYLLSKGTPIEFFFEGGRSRHGKLMPPRFGMFQMILSTHRKLKEKKPLLFIPVSIVHEMLPEEKSHAREIDGGKKSKEKTSELFKLYKVMDRKLGSIHINLGQPISVPGDEVDVKDATREVAFDCYRMVGRGMLVTPTAVLAMVLLDEPSGAMTLEDIMVKGGKIIDYCQTFEVPITNSLKAGTGEKSLKRALELLISSKKIEVIPNERLEQTYYVINEQNRVDLLYSKNTILHHFLVPFFINSAWIKVFTGSAKSGSDIGKLFLDQRKRLKYEFYLPTIKRMNVLGLGIVSHYTGKSSETLDDCMTFSKEEMFKLVSNINVFSRSCIYIFEAYYIGALTVKHLYKKYGDEGFKRDQYQSSTKEIFQLEKNHGRIIRYQESYSIFLMKNAFKFFENLHVIKQYKDKPGTYYIPRPSELDKVINVYLQDLTERLTININTLHT